MADLFSAPARLNLKIYHGRTDEIVLTWPADTLDGTGPWAATVTGDPAGPIDLPVTPVGDTLSLSVPSLDEALADVTLSWQLTDDDRPTITGRFTVSTLPGPSVTEAEVTVVEGEVVDVTVPPAPVPATPPSQQLAVAKLTGSDVPVAVANFLTITPVPGLVVTVPDVARPVWLHARAIVNHDTGPANTGLALAPPGSGGLGQQADLGATRVPGDAATDLVSVDVWYELEPNSPGDWQAFVWSGVGGIVTLRIQDAGVPFIRAVQY